MPERIIKRPYPDAERISDLSHGTYGQCRAAVHGAVLFHAVFVGVGLEKPRPVLKEKLRLGRSFLLIFLFWEISA